MICSVIISISNFFTKDLTSTMIIGILGLASFVGAILILIGAILFLMGRKEFGEKHQKNVMNAVILFIIYIIIVIIFTIVVSFMVYSAVTTGSSYGAMTSSFTMLIVITGAVLGGLIYYFGLIELENDIGAKFLFAGIISSITISIITSFYLGNMLGDVFGSIPTAGSNYSSFAFSQNFGIISLLGIIPNILFIYSFYIPYKRIKDGELGPVISSNINSPYPGRMCPNCGRPIPFDSNICPYCGKQF